MASITKKRLTDLVFNLASKFNRTDETKYDENVISQLADSIRAELIIAEYKETGVVDRNWLTDLGLVTFHSVNFADDPTQVYCCSNISKATIPNIIPVSKDGADLGIYSITSACGTKEYYPQARQTWNMIEKHPVKSLFNYYDRVNNALFINKKIAKLKITAVLASPEDGYIINSSPVVSGSLVSGVSYIVKGGQIMYDGTPRAKDSTFTANATATYTGTGICYLASQLVSLSETSAYPVSVDMARRIVLEILTKEFKIEQNEVADVLNDSMDDTKKV